jgi:hypothetical protein
MTADSFEFRSTQNVTLGYTGHTTIMTIDPAIQDTVVMTSFPFNFSGYSLVAETDIYERNASDSFDLFLQILTMKNTSVPLDAYLDASTLTAAAQALFTTYWSIFATLNLIIPVNTNGGESVTATVNYTRTRIIQTRTPTRILQVLLACVLVFGLLAVVVGCKTRSTLAKAPYTIGATMDLLVDSAFVELEGLAQVRREQDLDVLLEPYTFSLGVGRDAKEQNRFGVDVASG